VVASTPVADTPAPRGGELSALLAMQVASRRGKGTRARPEPGSLADGRVAARGEPALVYLTIRIAQGTIGVTADVYPVPSTVWARVRDPAPGPIAHAFAQAAVDAEVRAYLPAIPLTGQVDVTRAKNFENDVVALACGDVDGDGSIEIVSVSRRRVTTIRLRGGKVSPITSRSWPDLAPVAPAPLREPIAFATVTSARQGGLDVGLTDRAKSVRLDGSLRVVSMLGGVAVPDGDRTACTRFAALTITGPLAPCAPGDPGPLQASVGGQYDAFASALLTSPSGAPFVVWAGRERGVVELRDDSARRQVIDGAGAQLAIGDLDQDGAPEVITSLDVASPFEDAVVVRTWSRGSERPLERYRLPAAAGVHAIAVCPPDGPARAPFVVATADEIWVVR
jgi:hypothetical protein